MPQPLPAPDFFSSLPFANGVKVVKAQGSLVALYKPEGVRAHPNEDSAVDSGALLAAPFDMKRECYVLSTGVPIYLLHRIDAPTSGLLLLCTDETLAAKVKYLFAEHEVHKTYEALVFGDAGKSSRTWRDRLRTEHGGSKARTSAGAVGEPAVTDVRVAVSGRASGLALSLLTLTPATGRTHQLRVQCAARRLPIVGDATYGDFALNRRAAKELGIKRLCLHAAAVRFELDWQGKKFAFEARCPSPECFRKALQG